jgi:hypothetical protein
MFVISFYYVADSVLNKYFLPFFLYLPLSIRSIIQPPAGDGGSGYAQFKRVGTSRYAEQG